MEIHEQVKLYLAEQTHVKNDECVQQSRQNNKDIEVKCSLETECK